MTAKSQNYGFFDTNKMFEAAYLRAKDTPMRIFDWNKAARIIKERNPQIAEAGLAGDWDYTGGVIYSDGKIVSDSYTYLGSMWATPTLIVDGEDISCFIMEDETEWTEETKWPESALEILNG